MNFEAELYIQDKKTKKTRNITRKVYSISELCMIIENAIQKSDMRILGLIKGGKKLRRF